MGENVVADLQMLGLAGADQGRTGFRDHLDRRVSGLFKEEAVTLPGVPVPSGGAADVKAAVLILDQVSVLIELSQHACGEGADVLFALRIREETALEADLPLHRIRAVAGGFTDQKLSGHQPGIGSDKAFRVPD